jgi:uncharacterized protein with HEPN domain
MSQRDAMAYVEDILKAMDDAQKFVKDINYAIFSEDTKTNYAVIRALEIIGEATKNIPAALKSRYPEVPWKEMAGIRDKVIHAYSTVDLKRVWSTVKQDIPVLKPLFHKDPQRKQRLTDKLTIMHIHLKLKPRFL